MKFEIKLKTTKIQANITNWMTKQCVFKLTNANRYTSIFPLDNNHSCKTFVWSYWINLLVKKINPLKTKKNRITFLLLFSIDSFFLNIYIFICFVHFCLVLLRFYFFIFLLNSCLFIVNFICKLFLIFIFNEKMNKPMLAIHTQWFI